MRKNAVLLLLFIIHHSAFIISENPEP